MSPRVAPHALAIAVAIVTTGSCAPAGSCLEEHQIRRTSPSGDRVAVIYGGGCPKSGPPEIRVDFHSGGGLVFALRDSIAAIDAQWVTNDTLAIQYPASATVDERRSFSQYGRERVEVIYRPIP